MTEPPLADMLYMMQCVAPGMFTIVLEVEIGERGIATVTRALPRMSWVRENKDALVEVLGDASFERASRAALCFSETELDAYLPEYDVDDDWGGRDSGSDNDKDYAACDKECGYCGRCPY